MTGLGDISGRTWFNYARLIRSLFNYAQAKRYIPSGIDPMEGIEIANNDDGEIEIFTPEELKKLFAAARSELIPFLAIAAFAGVRHGEIARLEWRDISHTHITIEAGRAKTRSRRVIQIQPNLAKWLASYRKEFGPVAPFANMSKQLLFLANDAKVKWKHNALRHSFISYRLAATSDENLTAVEAGNSPTMIQHHYRQIKDHTGRVITPELAAAWFSIEPKECANIIPITHAA
ncbi:MAG: tyrosine-type recombinase/integrase [Limisphaerales bacterium]